MLESWLAARDGAAVRAAWRALSPRQHVVSRSVHRKLTLHGAAQLAQAMLGERADWIVDFRRREPQFTANRVVDTCFLDNVWDIGRCHETWELHEQREGARGVQLIFVGAGTVPGEGRPEGGGNCVVRVFDRDRAASIHVEGTTVSTIGEIDLAPLDLFDFTDYYKPAADDRDTLRAIVAQLASELDAHYDTSTLWPCIRGTPNDDEQVFAEGPRSITLRVDSTHRLSATVAGLPWGQHIHLERSYCWLRLPDADIDRVIARLHAATRPAAGFPRDD